MFVSARSTRRAWCFTVAVLLSSFLIPRAAIAQSELATVSGRVVDPSGAVIVGAEVEIKNVETNASVVRTTNSDGLYSIPSLHPGHYVLTVRQQGFRTVSVTDLNLNVQDNVVRNFQMQVGSAAESVTVTADTLAVNTTDATVSTVVDRNFAENLPMNGRSFQTLIQLTPGVVPTPSNSNDTGQFSVNGQRAVSNYWMVDGVSANIGIGSSASSGTSGSLGSFSAQGGTNSLVSVDAMQEFRIQTSTYAPEFGRTPGGQISIVTRAGTNQFHGTVFDYFRNDKLDANDWFATNAGLPKPRERQNDFGGTFSGPILRDRTFFFFSYEGLRLQLPQVAQTTVPTPQARQNATPALQPFLNAYPMPNGADLGNGIARFDTSYSNRSTLDAYSIRVDHMLNDKLNIFGRYNYSPSELFVRAPSLNSLSNVRSNRIKTQTLTLGSPWAIFPTLTNDLRFNYSKVDSSSVFFLDSFGGAVPLSSLPIPSPYSEKNATLNFGIFSLTGRTLTVGNLGLQIQHQVNFLDTLSLQKGSHSLKLGVDFRRLSPLYAPPEYSQVAFFSNVASAGIGKLAFGQVSTGLNRTIFLFRNLSVFAQDTWYALPRLSLTYGLRWDVDFAPSTSGGTSFPAVTGYNLADFSNLALAQAGTPAFRTSYNNFAPRVGAAYQLSQNPAWQRVLRGGFGVFFDMATSETGNIPNNNPSYPFGAFNNLPSNSTFPFTPAQAAPPPITPPGSGKGNLLAFNPNLKLPYTLQWNVALEQALGTQQTVTASYLGSLGRRLIQTGFVFFPNSNYHGIYLVDNGATSRYDALQIQFQRRVSHGLYGLASYTWSHSTDTASAGSLYGNLANSLVLAKGYANRGPSDFDIRHAFSGAIIYEIPAPTNSSFGKVVLGGWSIQNIVQVRSAPPVNVYNGVFFVAAAYTNIRPDVVPGTPLYLYGPQYPGGKAINPAAFTSPPTDSNGNPVRQGNLGRNALRGFGAAQWDFALHRDFPIHESLNLQFRTEVFNVLNHPNFGVPVADLSSAKFGRATAMLGRSLDQRPGGGSFSALYQLGGPRTIQLAMKLLF
jgi:carboxypeptidase family protein/TonB-dependent receptor-like protein